MGEAKYMGGIMNRTDSSNRGMTSDSFSFVIYMIHACANKWKLPPSEVYRILRDAGCINQYLVPNYEILHTQGTRFVVEDIREYLDVRGVAV